ncbi:hypothetical protein PAMA_005599 [Pampus argenteus]
MSQAAVKPQEHDNEDDFYDCQETLAPSDQRQDIEGETGRQEAEHTDRLNSNRLQEEEEEQGKRPEDKEQCGRLLEESDSAMKEGEGREVEFDNEYLREAEKDLTEEEKESRRQQSLALKEKGNSQFKAGGWLEAERSYTESLVLCPVCFSRERAVLFSNRAAARLHMDLKDQAISDCSRALELNPDYVRALLRRAELYEQTDKLDEALEDYKKVVDRDPNHTSARQACMRPVGPYTLLTALSCITLWLQRGFIVLCTASYLTRSVFQRSIMLQAVPERKTPPLPGGCHSRFRREMRS